MQHYLKSLGSNKRANLIALAFTVGTAFVAMCIFNLVQEVSYKSKCATVKENLHAIQLAVERYSVDHPSSYYPRDIRDLRITGYLPEFPTNPFTGLPMRCVEIPEVAPQDFGRIEQAPPGAEAGDFIYYKRYGKDGPASTDGNPTGYSLAAYF